LYQPEIQYLPTRWKNTESLISSTAETVHAIFPNVIYTCKKLHWSFQKKQLEPVNFLKKKKKNLLASSLGPEGVQQLANIASLNKINYRS